MHTTNTHFTFSMKLSKEKYERFYRGTAQYIIVMTHQGVSLQFPASAMRNYITNEGISGTFMITMDENNKLVALKKK